MPTASVATPANPFSTRFIRPDAVAYRFAAEQDADAVASATIEQLTRRGAAAIIGPHGTGKSTLLHTLAPQLRNVFPQIQWIQLSSASNAAKELRQKLREQTVADTASRTQATCLVIDGFEQLPWSVRLRLAWQSWRAVTGRRRQRRPSSAACLLVTAHRPQLGIKTIHRTGWDAALVKSLTAEKLRDLPEPERQTMLRLAEQLAGQLTQGRLPDRNVRDYWFALYDEYERLRPSHTFAASRRRNSR